MGSAVVPVLMPQVGNTMEEGVICKWRVQAGDRISVGQVLFEVETDKAIVEVEATDAGTLARVVALEGETVPIQQAVAYLAESDADLEEWLSAGGSTRATDATVPAQPERPAVSPGASPANEPALPTDSGRPRASPAARRIAAERGLDLRAVGAGSGPEGRIISTDLGHRGAIATGSLVRRPLSRLRKAIAANLQVAKATVPHFYVKLTIDADPLVTFQRVQKPATGCTLNDVILLAVGRTVGELPAFRSHLEGHELVENPAANIGVAVSVNEAVVVPVVLDVGRLTLAELARETKRVIEAARHGRLEHAGQAVFSISNLGMLGVEEFSAIINPPESGILAISAVREAVLVQDGVMRAGRVMTMILSVDHRVVDGALAAAFVTRLQAQLEAPAVWAI